MEPNPAAPLPPPSPSGQPVPAVVELGRLSPVMSSRKTQALAFIRDFLTTWPRSPSYAEIAAGIGVGVGDSGRHAAKRIVRQLVKDGSIVRVEGARRGIALPSAVDAAIAALRSCGYTIEPEAQRVEPPLAGGTRTTLTLVAELDHDPDA